MRNWKIVKPTDTDYAEIFLEGETSPHYCTSSAHIAAVVIPSSDDSEPSKEEAQLASMMFKSTAMVKMDIDEMPEDLLDFIAAALDKAPAVVYKLAVNTRGKAKRVW
jgi:hypothetical protein